MRSLAQVEQPVELCGHIPQEIATGVGYVAQLRVLAEEIDDMTLKFNSFFGRQKQVRSIVINDASQGTLSINRFCDELVLLVVWDHVVVPHFAQHQSEPFYFRSLPLQFGIMPVWLLSIAKGTDGEVGVLRGDAHVRIAAGDLIPKRSHVRACSIRQHPEYQHPQDRAKKTHGCSKPYDVELVRFKVVLVDMGKLKDPMRQGWTQRLPLFCSI